MHTKTYQIMLPFFFMYWNLWSDSTTCRRITVFYCDQVNIYFKSVFHLFWTPINAGCEIFGQKVNCLEHIFFIKWKHFPRYWPFLRRIHRSPVDSPHKGQWHGALMFSLNQQLSNQWRRRWCETALHSLWRHCNESSWCLVRKCFRGVYKCPIGFIIR